MNRLFRSLLMLLSVWGWMGGAWVQADEKPNIIIVFNDDQDHQDLGFYGSPDIKTPHIDRMAEAGMKFSIFMVASPVCSASPATLLSERYPNRVGLPRVFFPNRGQGGLRPELHKDGLSLKPIMEASTYEGNRILYWHYPHYHGAGESPVSVIRMGDLKLIRHYEGDLLELYDLREDLSEANNLLE